MYFELWIERMYVLIVDILVVWCRMISVTHCLTVPHTEPQLSAIPIVNSDCIGGILREIRWLGRMQGRRMASPLRIPLREGWRNRRRKINRTTDPSFFSNIIRASPQLPTPVKWKPQKSK